MPSAVSKGAAAAESQLVGLTLPELRARYAPPNAKFADLDGVSVHYADDGPKDAPVLLLLHGSYLDLNSWGEWVKVFGGDHRVIRVDRLGQGLTGIYDGEAVDYAHEQRLLDALVKHLGLTHVTVVGTSSGGIAAAQFADRHPDQVDKLVLMNFPLGHGRIVGGRAAAAALAKLSPLEQTRNLLETNIIDRSVITPALVAKTTALTHREDKSGAMSRAYGLAAQYTEEERAAMLGRLKMPVLVIWSAENRTLPVDAGQAAFAAIGSTDKTFVVLPDAGHMIPLERGAETASITRRFLAGESMKGAP